jgi:adenylosuccinate synthase
MSSTIPHQRGRTIIVEGGQYGSEGKGQIAAFIARRDRVAWAVRTGSINAGHTVYYGGRRCVMQLIPTAWVVPGVKLALGAGCYIEPEVLQREIELIHKVSGEDIRPRLYVDCRCTWFGAAERVTSQAANRHHAMGATGKGCSEAIVTKMRDRGDPDPESRLFSRCLSAEGLQLADTSRLLHETLAGGEPVLLEGTQGSLLDFNLGPYPYVTSRMTTAAAWLAEAGLPPVDVHTVLVLRSHPIRVAGNSGPLPRETSWPTLARQLNRRLHRLGRDPVAPEWALEEFETRLSQAVFNTWPEVIHELGEDRAVCFETWTAGQRRAHRVCLSEANALAWNSLPDNTRAALAFFELTSVTKKLRRVADFSLADAASAIAVNAPAEIAYTFLNYDFPELAGETMLADLLGLDEVHEGLAQLEDQLGVPVRTVTTGPRSDHVLDLTAELSHP